MRKIFFILLLLPAFCQAQIYIANQAGAYIAYGLSTQTKPVNPPTGSFFIETNTGNIYSASSSNWTLPTNTKTIKSVSDFPTPVSNVITLQDSIAYFISGMVDIGNNQIKVGIRNTFVGTNRSADILTSSTATGIMISIPSGKNLRCFNLTMSCPLGTLVDVKKSSLSFVESTIGATKIMGNIDSCVSFTARTSLFINAATTGGFTFTGTSTGDFTVFSSVLTNNVGTLFNFGTAFFHSILFTANPIICNTGQTIISGTTGGANVTSNFVIQGNTYSGTGTFVSTVTPTDANVTFDGNIGTTNTAVTIANGGTGGITASAARTNLGLGTSATQSTGTFLQAANNFSDVTNAATARTNIGAGTGNGTLTGTDTVSLSNRINTKQVAGSYATTAQNALKVNYTDTAAMLAAYQTGLNGKQVSGSYATTAQNALKVNYTDTSGMLTAYRTSLNGKQPTGSYLVAADIVNKVNYSDTSTMLSAYRASLNGKQATGSYQTQLNGTGFVKATGTTISYDNSTYLTSYTETDPIVKAINGLVKSNGTTISAAIAGTDYLTPSGSAAGLTSFPTLNQNTTGNAATVTTNANLTGPVTSLGNATAIAAGAITGTMTGQTSSTNLQSISAGTGYTLTATSARSVFGTTSPQITLSVAGTYLINYNVFTDYSAATLAVSRAISYKVRRTTNTAADLDLMPAINTPIITLLTFSAPMVNNSFIYTATAGDVLEVWGSISVIPTAGAVKTNYVSINATKLY